MLSFEEFTLKNPSVPFKCDGIKDKQLRSRKRNIHSAEQHRERKKRYISYLQTNAEDYKKKYEDEKQINENLHRIIRKLSENQLPDIVEEPVVSEDEFDAYLKVFYGNE